MTGKLVFFSFALCCGSLLSLFNSSVASEITEVRESAIRKLQTERKILDDLAHKLNFGSEQQKVISQTATRLNYGNVLSERIHFEIGQRTASYRLIAQLMKASKDVAECMEEQKVIAQQENDEYHMDKFYRPVRESEHKCHKAQMDKLFDWEWVRSELYKEYNKLYDSTMETVKNSESVSEIEAAVKNIAPKTESFIKKASEFVNEVRTMQLDQLKLGDDHLKSLREFVRGRMDNLAEALQNCFLVKSPYYNIKNILNKLM